jgi:hypothetical protein
VKKTRQLKPGKGAGTRMKEPHLMNILLRFSSYFLFLKLFWSIDLGLKLKLFSAVTVVQS